MQDIGIKISAVDLASPAFAQVGLNAGIMGQKLTNASGSSAQALDKVGISAAQTAFALRQVPAQFTDIVTSLQGGQAPLTVLLQQGGQLKDMFGGIGPAAKALGGYVAGLISPLTLAAGAVGVLGLAYYQGSKEADAYSKALILTGNAAGTTVGQLQAMAANVSNATGATTGAAAEALAALAGNGTLAGAQLEKFAGTAVRLQRETGVAVADTVKQFAELAKDPVDASTKLNETTHFLTLGIYEQIKALADQGKTADAAALATTAYANVMDERTGKLQANLGYVEQAWRGIVSGAKSAWDAMLGLGRAESLESKLVGLQERLASAQQRLEDARNSGIKQLGQGEEQREVTRLQAEIAGINGVTYAKKLAAEADALAAKTVQQKIDFDKRGIAYLTDGQKLQKAWNEEVIAGKQLLEAGAITAVQYYERLQAVEEKHKTKANAPGADNTKTVNDARFALIKAQEEQLSTLFEVENAKQQRLNELAYKGGTIDVEAYYATRARLETAAIDRKDTLLQQELSAASAALVGLTKEEDRLKAMERITKLTSQYIELGKERQKVDGPEEQALRGWERLNKAIAEADAQTAKVNADLLNQSAKLGDGLEEAAIKYQYQADTNGALKEELALIDLRLGREQKVLELKLAQSSLTDADKDTLRTRLASEAAGKSASLLAADFKKTSDSITTSLTDAFLNAADAGANIFQSMAKEIENTFKRLVLRPLISAAVNPIAQGITGALGLSGAASAADGAGSLLGTGASLAGLTGAATGFGQAAAATFSNGLISGFSANIGNIAALAQGGSFVTAIGAAMPYLLPVLAIGALLSGPGFKSSASTGSAAATFDPTGTRIGGGSVDFSTAAVDKIINGLQADYAKSAAALGIGAVNTNFNYAGNTGAQGENPQFALGGSAGTSSFYQGETAVNDAAVSLAASRAVFAALQGSDLPKYLAGAFDDITASTASQEQITATLASAQAFKTLHDSLAALPLANVADLSYSAAKGLVEAAGGFDKLTANISTYYDKFYSDAEKTAATTANVAKVFADIGVAMPTLGDGARAAFRGIVDGLDLTTAADQKAYAALIGVSAAFDSLIPPAEKLKTAAEIAKEALDKAAEAAKQTLSWQDKIDVAMGTTTAAALELRDALAGAATPAVAALISQFYELQNVQARGAAINAAGNSGIGRINESAATYASGYAFGASSISDQLQGPGGGIVNPLFQTQGYFDAQRAAQNASGLFLNGAINPLSAGELSNYAALDSQRAAQFVSAGQGTGGASTADTAAAAAAKAIEDATASAAQQLKDLASLMGDQRKESLTGGMTQLGAALYTISDAMATTITQAKALGASEQDLALIRENAARKSQLVLVDSTYATLQRSIEAIAKGNAGAAAQELSASVKSALDGMRREAPQLAAQSALEASAQIQAAIAIRNAGGTIRVADLQQSIETLAKPTTDTFATFADYARSFAQAQDLLTQLGGTGTTVDEQMLANNQALLDQAKLQVDALKGIDNSVLTVADALAAFQGAITGSAGEPALQIQTPTGLGAQYKGGQGQSYSDATFAALIAEVKALREELRAGQAAIASNTGKTARGIDQQNNIGVPAYVA